MKKKLLFPSLLLSLVMLLTCVCAFGVGAAEPKAMSGVTLEAPAAAGDVVTISSEDELKLFSAYVSGGGNTAGVEFRLEEDIKLSELAYGKGTKYTNLKPIGGMYDGATAVVAFQGVFNGNGKTISGLQITDVKGVNGNKGVTVTAAQGAFVGLFAKLDGATVKNLTVTVATIKNVGTNGYVGVIAAEAVNAKLTGCVVSMAPGTDNKSLSSLKTGAVFGGLVGKATGSTIDGCTAALEATGKGITGGFVGVAEDTTIRNSVVGGTYKHQAASALGGFVGELQGASAIENCYSSATVDSKYEGDKLGGVAAVVGADASVENCFSAASVSSEGNIVYGVLVGENKGRVHHSFALREEENAASFLVGHKVIGSGNDGTEVYAYQPKTEGETTEFVVGTVETILNGKIECWAMGGDCKQGETPSAECNVCGGTGVTTVAEQYKFKPVDSGIGSLEDALNDWVGSKAGSGIAYAGWMTSGDTITNCLHSSTEYRNITTKPTCSTTGIGDKHCAVCGTLLEAAAEVPVDPSAHSKGDNAKPCVGANCVYGCGTFLPAAEKHDIGDKHCTDQECKRCGTMVPASQGHTNPNYDANKPCAEYDCSVCGAHTSDADHNMTEAQYSCQDVACSVCGYVAQKGTPHRPGRAANCYRAQTCTVCSTVIVPAKKCVPGPLATCGADQVCINCGQNVCDVCGAEYGKASGDHTWNKEHATCTVDKHCKVCGEVSEKKTGHTPDQDHAANCGAGRACLVCHVVLEAAFGEHDVDWANATVIRAATPERTGIVVGVCKKCQREVEAYTSCAATEQSGNALVTGGSLTLYAGSHVKVTFGKVADYKDVTFADGYLPIQVVTLSLLDANGAAIDISGGVTAQIVLNKSAAKMASGTLKLYSVVDGKATEVAITAQEDGSITFNTVTLGTFVLVGEKTAAFTELGSIPVQVKQTAALVGTPAYDRRDFEI